jgi:DNA primase catalytic core
MPPRERSNEQPGRLASEVGDGVAALANPRAAGAGHDARPEQPSGERGDGLAALASRAAAGADRTEAVRLHAESLAASAGIKERVGLALAPPTSRERLLEAHRLAMGFYTEQLDSPAGASPMRYLENRGVAWAIGHRDWRIGYAPRSRNALTNHLRSWGFADREIVEAGLAYNDNGSLVDLFRDRVMFGIRDPDHPDRPIIGFVGRARPGKEPKYINSPNTAIYHKSSVLFGLAEQRDQDRSGGPAVVVEGPMDVLAVAGPNPQRGSPVAVGTCGTALTAEHVGSLTRHVDTGAGVIAAFDADTGGRRAADRAYHLLTPAYEQRAHRAGRVLGIEWPDGQDPASIAERPGGRDTLATMLRDQPRPLIEQVIDHQIAKYREVSERKALPGTVATFDTSEGKVKATRALVLLIAERPPQEVAQLSAHIARRLGLPIPAVQAAVIDHYEGTNASIERIRNLNSSPTSDRPPRTDRGARAAVATAAQRLSRGEPVAAQPPAPRRPGATHLQSQERGA